MKINFNEMNEEALKEFNGGIGEFNAKIFNDGDNKILLGRLKKNNSIGLHKHIDSCEIIYVLSGCGKMITDGEIEILNKGDATYCPRNSSHTFVNENDEDLIFFAVVPKKGK